MAYGRALLLFWAILAFVVLGLPAQWLAMRVPGRARRVLPAAFCRLTCVILGMRLHFVGRPGAERPQLVVSNHVSWTDVLVLNSRHPVCFLAKREVAAWPVFGWMARVQGSIFVDRTRRRALPAVNRAIADRMAAGDPVVLFAEGTTGDGTRTLPFRSSHFAAARDLLASAAELDSVAIQPVALSYWGRHGLPLGRQGRAGLAWYGDADFGPHMWDLLRAAPIDCEIVYGAPLRFVRGADRKVVTRDTERAVRGLVAAMQRRHRLAQQSVLTAAENA